MHFESEVVEEGKYRLICVGTAVSTVDVISYRIEYFDEIVRESVES
jgi:hypothetical protein